MYMYCSVSRVQCVTEAVETTSLIQRESARSTSPGGGAAGADDDDDDEDGGGGGQHRHFSPGTSALSSFADCEKRDSVSVWAQKK